MSSIRYQAHIDGLRAVAVLLVIFHHLGNWGGLTGGYIGVDVFFVISGYLITRIVKGELEEGRFTFGGFYRRRIVRLAPAYFLVLLTTTLAALIWMLPSQIMEYARSMAASSVFLANVYMWKEVGGYFGTEAHNVPLVHLWSLAVEEQFYLFWPVVLLVAHRYSPRPWLLWLALLVVVGAVAVSQWGVTQYPAASYYLLPTRVFELAVGAVVAYLPPRARRPTASNAMSFAGIVLICVGAFIFDAQTPFPGCWALIPVLGTAFLLYWGEGTMVGRALSTPAATLIGKISYPAYLWHWPIIVFLHINEIPLTVPAGITVVAATLVLSWFTYHWLELPARRFLTVPICRLALAGVALPIGVSLASALLVLQHSGLPDRFSKALNAKDHALHASASEARGECHGGAPGAPAPADACILGRVNGPVNFLLVGDSHANHFTGFLDVLGKDAAMRGYDITRDNAPFLPRVELHIPNEPEYGRNFGPRNRYVSSLLSLNNYDVVVLAGSYESIFNRGLIHLDGTSADEAFESGFRWALTEASASASLVLVMTPIPRLDDGLPDCGLRAARFGKRFNCTLPRAIHVQRTARLKKVLLELRNEFPDVVWIDTDKLLCGATRCVTEINGIPLYKDSGHLNDVGSRLLAEKWIASYGNPLRLDATPAPHSVGKGNPPK